jgi:FKBP-type peptidyl-prolyl cis-trans isomerase
MRARSATPWGARADRRSIVILRRAAVVALVLGLVACGGDNGASPSGTGTLAIEDLVVGTGATAAAGDTVTVNYVGTLQNGTKFDSSYDRNQPLTFRLGAGQVIAGWDQGVPGMRVGGRRKLSIPPSLAYGTSGYGPIPPNATLIFEIELLAVAGK